MMLDENQIRAAIIERLEAADGTGSLVFLHHTDGIIRGLLWALTGADHGVQLTANTPHILQLAGIPHRVEAGRVHYGEAASPS